MFSAIGRFVKRLFRQITILSILGATGLYLNERFKRERTEDLLAEAQVQLTVAESLASAGLREKKVTVQILPTAKKGPVASVGNLVSYISSFLK